MISFKFSQDLTGCTLISEETNITILSSDEKVIISLSSTTEEERVSWTMSLQEAIQRSNKESGFEKFGWLNTKNSKSWVVLTNKTLYTFKKTQPVEFITGTQSKKCFNLANCSLIAQGDLGFIVTCKQGNYFVSHFYFFLFLLIFF
jgi:hypothetical protein